MSKKIAPEITNVVKIGLSRQEAAIALGTTPGVLGNWAVQRKGPRFFRIGRRCLYLPEDLRAFATANPVLTMDQHT
jgi:hypothetical protein